MSDLKKLSMSELIARHNALASARGSATVTEFKNLAAARAAVTSLETGTHMSDNTAVATETVPGDKTKYSSIGKRGPNQGIGPFAKELIIAGKTNPEVLAAVKEKFESAKTTMGCIAYYRAAVKNPNMGKRTGKSPEALRADAAAILAKAEAIEAAAAAKASAEAAAVAEPQ